jgi:hypothetical protein
MIGWALLMFGLAAWCAVVAVKPRATWRALAGWQFKNPEGAELTDSMYVLRSVSAGFAALFLVGTGIWLLVTEDEQECEQVLSELEATAAGVDFDTSDLEEIADDFEARWDLDVAAANLDVELEEHGSSVSVVAEDGEVLGTIDEDGVHSLC